MLNKFVCVSAIATLAASALPGPVPAQQGANVSGAYWCEPEPSPCPWPGQTMSITQAGPALDLNNQDGSFADAKLTSDITISGGPPWNAIGVVLPDHSIQWSNGTLWRKQ
jgi:hypothetical protein